MSRGIFFKFLEIVNTLTGIFNTYGHIIVVKPKENSLMEQILGKYFSLVKINIGGSEGGARDALPPRGPNSFIFIQFSTKNIYAN